MTVRAVPKPAKRTKSARKPLGRGKSPRKVNPKRRKSEFARCYGSKQRVEWVKWLPCIAKSGLAPCDGPTENAHTQNGGMGRKGDAASIIPLCQRHHRSLHQIGPVAFQAAYALDLERCAYLTQARWEASQK